MKRLSLSPFLLFYSFRFPISFSVRPPSSSRFCFPQWTSVHLPRFGLFCSFLLLDSSPVCIPNDRVAFTPHSCLNPFLPYPIFLPLKCFS
ncbi:hypothetical protein DFJ73DRAFT_807534 [Zopfochytrium polystomum]|nr:hypothetical protein DFJ73DRAFT_807534 [Zopfochytrium polystomum]